MVMIPGQSARCHTVQVIHGSSGRLLAAWACAALLLAGCSTGTATPAGVESSEPSASQAPASVAPEPSESAAGGTRAIEGGTLQPGVRYVAEALGLTVQPAEDDWYSQVIEEGQFMLSRERIAVWFVIPLSIRPDGAAASTEPAPTDPAAFAEAIDGHPAVTVMSSEPFTADGLEGLLVDLESQGMSEGSALLLTKDGAAYGFPDGEGRILLLPHGDELVMISPEGGESRDAAWEVASPLLETLASAP